MTGGSPEARALLAVAGCGPPGTDPPQIRRVGRASRNAGGASFAARPGTMRGMVGETHHWFGNGSVGLAELDPPYVLLHRQARRITMVLSDSG